VTRAEWRALPPLRDRRCVACGSRNLRRERHHVIREQVVRRAGGSVFDARNRVLLCWRCHAEHTNRAQKIALACLPDSAFEFARELLGPGRAYNLLRREYSGEDERLEVLLSESAESPPPVRRAKA